MGTLSCSLWELVPWLGIKPGPPAFGAWSLSQWTTRKSQSWSWRGECVCGYGSLSHGPVKWLVCCSHLLVKIPVFGYVLERSFFPSEPSGGKWDLIVGLCNLFEIGAAGGGGGTGRAFQHSQPFSIMHEARSWIYLWWKPFLFWASQVVKNLPTNGGDMDSIPGWERSAGEGNGNPLEYSGQEKSHDRGAWWATVHGVTKSWPWFRDWAHAYTY